MKEVLKKYKKLFIGIGVSTVIAAVGTSVVSGTQAALEAEMEAANMQETAEVERRSVSSSVSSTGTVTSVDQQTATATVTGVKVTSVNVKVGDVVKKGDTLVTLDSSDLKASLADARENIGLTGEKNEIDINAAKRSLAEAKASRDINRERASEDAAKAWNNYIDAYNDLLDAESEYYSTWNEMADAADAFNAKSAELSGIVVVTYEGEASDSISKRFDTVKEMLKQSVVLLNKSDYDVDYQIDLDTDFTLVHATDIIGNSTNGDVQVITSYLDQLETYQEDYLAAAEGEAEAAASEALYQTVQAELTELDTKYTTLEAEVDGKKSAYDAADSAADTALDAYKTQVRSGEDAERNDSSDIKNKQDSVDLSEIGASNSTQQDEKSISDYERQIEECTVVAEISGVVTELPVTEGGVYSGGTIVRIEDESDYEITTQIDEYDINKIKEGQSVVIKTNGTGDKELSGKVKSIAPRATSAGSSSETGAMTSSGSSTASYQVVITVDTADAELKMDMTAKLSIVIDQKDDVLTVPYNAVQEDEDGSYIEVLDTSVGEVTDDTEEFSETKVIRVEKGIESDFYVEVTGDELEEGMTVIVPESDSLDDLDDLGEGLVIY